MPIMPRERLVQRCCSLTWHKCRHDKVGLRHCSQDSDKYYKQCIITIIRLVCQCMWNLHNVTITLHCYMLKSHFAGCHVSCSNVAYVSNTAMLCMFIDIIVKWLNGMIRYDTIPQREFNVD